LMRHFAQTEADRQRRIVETFSKAVEQLGSDKLEVRVGAIFALGLRAVHKRKQSSGLAASCNVWNSARGDHRGDCHASGKVCCRGRPPKIYRGGRGAFLLFDCRPLSV
jgi:hypothetical protein